MSNIMKIHPVGAKLFHADGQTERHDEANRHFLQFCECLCYTIIGFRVIKLNTVYVIIIHTNFHLPKNYLYMAL
jgi:hypothetical protein